MSENLYRTLLPEGLRDLLPPQAAFEAEAVDKFTACFAANGYERVKPPLIEFEETLLSGVGGAVANRIFRMIDPVSQRMLGLRADVTTQIARIAATRLADAERPLRLMYSGQVLRVSGRELRPERQFTQVGIELIGAESSAADAEVIVVLADALSEFGVKNLTIDMALPNLVRSVCNDLELDDSEYMRLRQALDHKDVLKVRDVAGAKSEVLISLVEASGPLEQAQQKLLAIELSDEGSQQLNLLFDVAARVRSADSSLALTLDVVESRGFEYHSGVTFAVFSNEIQREVGRGGRYNIEREDNKVEPATGGTLFVDSLLELAGHGGAQRRLYVPIGTQRSEVQKYQREGWSVVSGLSESEDFVFDAVRLGCTHVLLDDVVQDLTSTSVTT